MSKQIFKLLILLFASNQIASAQIKIDKYCKVSVYNKTKIYFGSPSEFAPKDTTVLQKLRLVTQLKTEVDILDYMAKLGWKLVDIHAAGLYTITEVIYFKKEFDSTELLEHPLN